MIDYSAAVQCEYRPYSRSALPQRKDTRQAEKQETEETVEEGQEQVKTEEEGVSSCRRKVHLHLSLPSCTSLTFSIFLSLSTVETF